MFATGTLLTKERLSLYIGDGTAIRFRQEEGDIVYKIVALIVCSRFLKGPDTDSPYQASQQNPAETNR